MTEARDTGEGAFEEWAYGSPAREARLIGEQIKLIPGYDLEKVLRGQIVERILGDDVNPFNSANMAFDKKVTFDPGLIESTRQSFLIRLRWELDQPLTPAKVKESIKRVAEEIGATDWKTEDDVSKARGIWQERVHRQVLQMLAANEGGLKDAREEYRKFYDEVSRRGLPH